ncbi:DUF427 domain-containing protein [Adhaeretor mobilis]|nr:DUF427 domain-containing protein [Adhaeretor mobilis]
MIEDCTARIRVVVCEFTVADSTNSKRVLETSHPPVYYIPPQDVSVTCLKLSDHMSWCEWKGSARYYALTIGDQTVSDVAWCYPDPAPRFAELQDHLAFYPSKADACYVDDELVRPQKGDFYGGWITEQIVGPFKGGPATMRW